jgi:hypothetical protein
VANPLGCHRLRIPDRIVFDKLMRALVFGCAYRRIADNTCSATTLRRRRDEGKRWVVEPTTAWTNAHKQLVWCTGPRAIVFTFWIAFSAVIIIVGRLMREAWTRYRWATRPSRRP